jgi:TetR/AcrR family transcriptional regulator
VVSTQQASQGDGNHNPANRERILLAGLAEFAAVGFDGASISAIAARSGLNKQLIYHYFGNKRGLYDAVLRTVLERTVPIGSAGIADLFRSFLDFSSAGDWVRMLGWEGLRYDGGNILHARQRGEALGVLRRDIEDLQREGRLDPRVEPELATLFVTLALLGPGILPQLTKIITGEDASSPDFRRRLVRSLSALLGAEDLS